MIVMRLEGRAKGVIVGAWRVRVGREKGIARDEVKTTGWVFADRDASDGPERRGGECRTPRDASQYQCACCCTLY